MSPMTGPCSSTSVNRSSMTPARSRISSTAATVLPSGDNNEEREKEIKQEFSQTCDWSSPCVLVAAKFGWSANMERLMRAQSMGDTSSLDFMRLRKVFEINQEHEIIKALNAASGNNPEDPEALKALQRLTEATEKAKMELSSLTQTNISGQQQQQQQNMQQMGMLFMHFNIWPPH